MKTGVCAKCPTKIVIMSTKLASRMHYSTGIDLAEFSVRDDICSVLPLSLPRDMFCSSGHVRLNWTQPQSAPSSFSVTWR